MHSRFLQKLLYEDDQGIIIVNPQVAATVAEEFASRVQNPIFKSFLSRRVRQEMVSKSWNVGQDKIRNPLHVPVSAEQVTKMFSGEEPPAYVQQAMAMYKPLFMIALSGEPMASFRQHVEHIVDWFNAMEFLLRKDSEEGDQVAIEDKALTNKAISNLPRQTIEQATKSSEAWYARMGKRVRGSKSDVIVLKRWPDGYYGIQYKANADGFKAMQADGNDLQNCLRYGHYEPYMKSGEVRIYAIRLPNDEAVVGIALHRDGSVKEVKGKQNEPVTAAYASYAADFLTALKAKPANAPDLTRAEIEYKNGRFFVFQHDAALVFEHQNVKVWKNEDVALIQIGKSIFIKLGIDAGKLTLLRQTKVPEMDGSTTTRMLMALGALDMPPDAQLAEVLSEKCDIHFGGSEFAGGARYGKFDDTAETVYNQGDVIAKKTDSELRIWNNAPGEGDEQAVGFALDHGRLNNMSPVAIYDKDDQHFDKAVLAKVLTAIKMVPTPAGLQMILENKFGIDYKDGHWGEFNDIAKVLYDRNGYKTWGTEARLYFAHEDVTLSASLYGKGIYELDFTSEYDDFHPAKTNDPKLGVKLDTIVGMLNTVKIPPSTKTSGYGTTQTVADKLFEAGIVFTGAEYAKVVDAAEVLYEHGQYKLIKSVTVSTFAENAYNEDGEKVTSRMRDRIIVIDERNLYVSAQSQSWARHLLDHILHYTPFVFHHKLVDMMGRTAFCAMANAAGLIPDGDGKMPRSYGLDIRGGAGHIKKVEDGHKAIFPGFYQVTPKSWVLAVDKGTVIYLTLRDGELSAEQFTQQDRSLVKQLFPRAVQWIAKTHDIINGPLNSGLLNPHVYDNLGDTVAATFDTLLERIKNVPEAAYMPFIKKPAALAGLERFFDGLGKLTKKQQLALYSAVRPKAPGYKIIPDGTFNLYGKVVERHILRLPAALFLTEFDDGAGISDPALIEKMRSDIEKIVFKVIDLVRDTVPSTLKPPKVYKVFKLQIGELEFLPAPGIPQQENLAEALRELRIAVADIMGEAERIDDEAIRKGKTYKDYSEREIMDRFRMEETGTPWNDVGASEDTRKHTRAT